MSKGKRTEELFAKIRDGAELSVREEVELVARLSVPAILANISFVVMQYIDAAMVGHLGALPAAAVALVSTSLWLFFGLTAAVTSSFCVQVSHRIGAKDFKGARSVFRQSILASTLIGCLIAAFGGGIHQYLPGWLGGAADLHRDASAYFLVFSLGFPIMVLSFIFSGMLRSTGNVQLPSYINVAACFLDVFFNFLFIYPTDTYHVFGREFTIWGAGWGVAGAAAGTLAAELIAVLILGWFLIVKNDKLALIGHPGSFLLTKETLKRSFNIGSPIALERCAMGGAQMLTTVIVAPLGTVSLAAHSFAITAESLCYMPGYGIADAASSLIGQSYGAKRKDLIKKFSLVTIASSMVIMTVMGLVMYVFASQMIRIMSPDTAIISLGATVLRIEAFAEPMFAAAIVAYSVFVAMGKSLVGSLTNFLSIWLIRLPAAYLLAQQWGLVGVWIAMAGELMVRGMIFLILLKKYNRQPSRSVR